MPSAAVRQMIPSDLWPSGRHSPGRCSPLQASPVQTETEDAKAKLRKIQNPHSRGNNPQRKDQKRQRTLSAKAGGNSASCVQQQRPGSSQELGSVGRVSPKSLPCLAKSPDSGAFAMETPPAPHPSSLPMPPMEWLKPKAQSPLTVGHSLQAILTCRVAA